MKKALFWKLMERFGVQSVQFILQLILARMLDPDLYGVLSLMVVFTTLANVFIQNGFNTALVQNKDVTDDDYSSVFWVSLSIALALYGVLFLAAPAIGVFYEMPDIVQPLRVLSLMLIPGAFNSVQLAKVSREMDFKQVFHSNIGGVLLSGIVGIVMAYLGMGLWALVAQTLLNVLVACLVMFITVKWRPKLVCNFARVKVLFSFGWKLLVSSLLDTLYQDIRSLVIGKKYDAGTLAYYNRGKQFPQFMIGAINGAIQSVMLPAMSAEQDEPEKVKVLMRNSITISSYLIFPMMAGLAAVAPAMIELLLTEKWLPCVPYLQVYCFSLAFYPVHACNLQAINAVGRSDMFLKLELIKKSIGLLSLVIAVVFFDSPLAIAMTGIFTTVTSCFINAYPNKKLIGYSYLQQMKDILPSFVASLAMCGLVLATGLLQLPCWLLLILQVFCGIVAYLAISVLFQLRPIEDFLRRVDSDFPVPLSQKQDLSVLAQKLSAHATICTVKDGNEILAMVAGYTENLINNMAYISVAATVPEARGNGLASGLIETFLRICVDKKISAVHLYAVSSNLPAMNMYRRLGFVLWDCPDETRPEDAHLIKYL